MNFLLEESLVLTPGIILKLIAIRLLQFFVAGSVDIKI